MIDLVAYGETKVFILLDNDTFVPACVTCGGDSTACDCLMDWMDDLEDDQEDYSGDDEMWNCIHDMED